MNKNQYDQGALMILASLLEIARRDGHDTVSTREIKALYEEIKRKEASLP